MYATSPIPIALVAALVGASCSNGTPGPAPARPTDLTAETVGAGCVRLTWTDTSTDETEFTVVRRKDGEADVVAAVLPADTTTFTDRGLEPGTDWIYAVQTRRGTEISARSDEATVRTAASGFAVFSRSDGAGGEGLYLASGDGTLPARRLASHPGQTIRQVAAPAGTARAWVVYQTSADPAPSSSRTEVYAAPLDCADPTAVRLLGRGDAFRPVGTAGNRFAVAALDEPARLTAFDLDLGTETTLASFGSGFVSAAPSAPFAASGEFVMTHSDFVSAEAYAVAADGSSSPRPLLAGGITSSVADDLFGFPAVRGSSAIVRQCSSSSCPVRTLVLVRDDGLVRQPVATLSDFGLGSAPFRLILREDYAVVRDWAPTAGTINGPTDLYAMRTSDGTRTNLTAATADEIVEWDGDTSAERAVFVGLQPDRTPTGVYSVPLDGSAPPIELSVAGPGPYPIGEFSQGLTVIGEWVFFTRQSMPNDVFAAQVSVAGSERRVPIDGRVVSLFREEEPVAQPNEPAAARRMIARAVRGAGGAQTFSDYWSIAPDGAGGLEILALSDRFGTQTPDSGASPANLSPTPKAGRILYLRGNDLYSAAPGTADSELRLTELAGAIDTASWDPASADPNVFFVSDGQVWATAVDASFAARRLTDLPPGTSIADLHAADAGGRIWFTTQDANGLTLWAAAPATPGGAVPIAPVDSTGSFRFAF